MERGKGEAWTRFTYDGEDVVLDMASDGSTVEYVNGLATDEKLARRDARGTHYFVADHLGSTRALADASGAVVERLDYDSFGDGAGSAVTRYGYAGREMDADTGLLYYRARCYDPQTGRFISEDPSEFDGGVNWYAYVGGNPLSFNDPDGQILNFVLSGAASVAVKFFIARLTGACYTWADVAVDLISGFGAAASIAKVGLPVVKTGRLIPRLKGWLRLFRVPESWNIGKKYIRHGARAGLGAWVVTAIFKSGTIYVYLISFNSHYRTRHAAMPRCVSQLKSDGEAFSLRIIQPRLVPHPNYLLRI